LVPSLLCSVLLVPLAVTTAKEFTPLELTRAVTSYSSQLFAVHDDGPLTTDVPRAGFVAYVTAVSDQVDPTDCTLIGVEEEDAVTV